MDVANTDVHVVPGEPSLLLRILRGEVGRESLGKEVVVRLGDLVQGTVGDGLFFVWPIGQEHRMLGLPGLILGSPEKLNDLLAWSGAYMKPLSPLTSLIRVITRDDLAKTLWRARDLKPAMVGAMVGAVLGEATVNWAGGSESLASVASFYSLTTSFAVSRLVISGLSAAEMDVALDEWDECRRLLAAVEGSPSISSVWRVMRALMNEDIRVHKEPFSSHGKTGGWELRGDLFGGVEDDLLGSVVGALKAAPAEERVKIFDQMAPRFADLLPTDQAARALGILAATSATSLAASLRLIAPFANRFPDSALWCGGTAGRLLGAGALSSMEGLGWRVWRDASAAIHLLLPPVADVSIRELRVLGRAKSGGAIRRIARGARRSRFAVELSSSVTVQMRVASDRNVSAEVEVQEASNREVSNSELLAALANVARNIDGLREEISRGRSSQAEKSPRKVAPAKAKK